MGFNLKSDCAYSELLKSTNAFSPWSVGTLPCPAKRDSPNQTSTTPASAQFPALFTVVNLTVDWFYLPELSAMWAAAAGSQPLCTLHWVSPAAVGLRAHQLCRWTNPTEQQDPSQGLSHPVLGVLSCCSSRGFSGSTGMDRIVLECAPSESRDSAATGGLLRLRVKAEGLSLCGTVAEGTWVCPVTRWLCYYRCSQAINPPARTEG